MIDLLVVDDEPRVLRYLAKLFRSVSDLELRVHEAKSVRDAVDILDRHEVDIIVTDYRMPGRTGLDLLDYARSRRPAVQVVVLSAYREFEYIYAATGHGAVRYLLKTEDDEIIVRTVRDLVISREESPHTAEAAESYSAEVLSYIDRCADVRRFLITGEQPARAELDTRRPVVIAAACGAVLSAHKSDSDRLVWRARLQDLTDDALPGSWRALVLDDPHGFPYWILQDIRSVPAEPRLEPLLAALRCVSEEAMRRYGVCLHTAIADRPVDWTNLTIATELLFVRTTEAQVPGCTERAEAEVISLSDSVSDDGRDELAVRVKSYVLCHIADDLSLDAIAAAVHYSPHYVSRTFAQRFGTSLSSYIEAVRVERGRTLLKRSDKRIADIASQCGYSSPKYFASVFRRVTGMAPNEYRAHERTAPYSDS